MKHDAAPAEAEIVYPTTCGPAPLSSSGLAPRDVVALCRHLALPTPTPDVTFDSVARMAGLTLGDVYDRCASATDVSVMIAAAALRVRRLPPDPRLSPRPHRKTPNRRAGEADPAPVADVGARVLVAVGPCPSKAGSSRAARFALLAVGLTWDALVARGVRARDLERYVAGGHATFSAAAEGPEDLPAALADELGVGDRLREGGALEWDDVAEDSEE